MTTTNNPPRAVARAGSTGWSLSRAWRRAVLVSHIVSAGAWIGIDVLVAILVLTGWFSPDVELRSLAYRALAQFIVAPMLISGIVCLITGVLLGLGTKWGLVRYWWVALKLVLTVILCVTIIVVLAPGMPDVDRYGAALAGGAGMLDDTVPASKIATLFFPPAVSLTVLTTAVVLAVAKPWGRTRRGGRRS